MYEYVSAQLVSFIYVVILSIVYFLKRKYNFLESKVYKSILIATIVTLFFDIFGMYILDCGLYNSVLTQLFSKLYFI